MKKLLITIFLLLSILACSAQTQPRRLAENTRPYLLWKIYYEKAEDEKIIKGTAEYQVWDLKEALSRFYADCPYCTVKCASFDSNFLCNERSY